MVIDQIRILRNAQKNVLGQKKIIAVLQQIGYLKKKFVNFDDEIVFSLELLNS